MIGRVISVEDWALIRTLVRSVAQSQQDPLARHLVILVCGGWLSNGMGMGRLGSHLDAPYPISG